MKPTSWWRNIHRKLVEGSVTASAELVEEALIPLEEHLRFTFPSCRDDEIVSDAATDAIINYVTRPATFDGKSRTLLGFLKMAAEGDFKNLARKKNRPLAHEILTDPVELRLVPGNEDEEGLALDAVSANERLDSLFPGEIDRKLARLVIDGERSTQAYATLLGLTEKPVKEQRTEVKRHKDRIKKVLERHGKKPNE